MVFRIVQIACLLISLNSFASAGYFRSPALHESTLVFTAEGDLWVTEVSAKSIARRLTTHPAEESDASISFDGKFVAYTANYEGAREIYIIPIHGGLAKRVTYENSSVNVQGWTASGDILYSVNNRVGPSGNWSLRSVNPSSMITKNIPLADAVEGSIDAKGEIIYFTQFGLQISRDNAKVYRGGAKGEIWRFSLGKKKEAKKLTSDHIGSSRQPMVYNNKLYFISDASGRENLWSMNLDGTQLTQVTHEEEWPIRSASLHNNRIAYQQGADIKLLNLSTQKQLTLDIQLTSDFPNLREKWVNNPLDYLNSTRMAPANDRVVITARGRVAVASIDKSRLIEIKTDPQSRTRQAILSHDGQWVYAINDASGEHEIWRFAADGTDNSKQLTKKSDVFRWNIVLSPDGKWLANDNKKGDLWLLNIKTGKNKKVLSGQKRDDPFSDIVWSSDSKLLAVTRSAHEDERNRIVLYSVKEKKHQVLTSDKYNSYSPYFSPDGDWLYFLSDRHFKPTPSSPWGDRNMGTQFDRRTQIYAYSLQSEAKFPFQPVTELSLADGSSAQSKGESNDDDEDKESTKSKKIAWKGLKDRLWLVPIESGNYSRLSVNKKYLFVVDQINEPESKPLLKSIEIKANTKPEVFTQNVAQYALSTNGEKLFVRKSGNGNRDLFIVGAGAKFPAKVDDAKVQVQDWQLVLTPRQEWKQIFHDAWLMHRDSLFDQNMRGVNWEKAHKKYAPLLDRITDRYELNDVLAHLVGEVNTLHSQVGGGDTPSVNRPSAATLGGVLSQSKDGVKIERIYRYDPELPSKASPLLHPSVGVEEGDVIVAVNGLEASTLVQVHAALRNQVGRQLLLTLKRNDSTFKTIVIPTSTREDFNLRYNDWVWQSRNKVEASHDDIGYLHLRAMGGADVAYFAQEFYANYHKQGLIIDVRRNYGGNIDSWVIEKLLRRAWAFWQLSGEEGYTNMQQTFRGHLVVLADEYTYSDGETFTAAIKALKLAPVIGKRTAGAGVWLRDRNRLVDNGIARVAEYAQYAMDGRWVVEGHGVEPDIEISNLPFETFNGKDAQLEAAIDYLKKKIKKEPISPLKSKAFPSVEEPALDINAE